MDNTTLQSTTTKSKSQQAFETMNQDVELYGEASLSEFELQQYNRYRNAPTLGPVGDQVNETARRIKEMMKVDVVRAEMIKEEYPDLYEEAMAELQEDQQTAQISGTEKLKQEKFGKKTRDARARMEEIEKKRDAKKKASEKRAVELANSVISGFDDEISEMEQKLAENPGDVILEGKLTRFKDVREKKEVLAVECIEATLYQEPAMLYNQRLQREISKNSEYKNGVLTRDITGFVTPLDYTVEAKKEDAEKALNAAVKLHKVTKLGPEKAATVTNKERKEAIDTVMPHLERLSGEIMTFAHKNQELFMGGEVPLDLLLSQHKMISFLYKKTQMPADIAKAVIRTMRIEKYSETEISKVKSLLAIIEGMQKATQWMNEYIRNKECKLRYGISQRDVQPAKSLHHFIEESLKSELK